MFGFIAHQVPLSNAPCRQLSSIRSICVRRPQSTRRCIDVTPTQTQSNVSSMQISIGRPSLYTGVAILIAVLANRSLFTPLDSLAMTQSRSDILGVIAGATLVLYGVGKAEVVESKAAVELDGVDLRLAMSTVESIGGPQLAYETEWAANAIFKCNPNICSFVLITGGVGLFFYGRFRSSDAHTTLDVPESGTIYNSMVTGQRAYLADMKVVPVKETEFGFFPVNCQAVIIQPLSETSAIVLGAKKPRPLTGSDFGWIQAIANRVGTVLESNQ